MAAVQWTSKADRTSAGAAPQDFDALFLSGYPRLVRTLTFICGDAEVAADCVADAFERAFVRWRRVGSLEDPLGWVRRVAVNRATDAHRRRSSARRALRRLGARPDGHSPPDITMSDSASFHDSDLAAAVADLSRQQRAVVALHYLDDMSVLEVAAVLSLSEGAVKYHLHQARQRLRSILRPDGPRPEVPQDDDPEPHGPRPDRDGTR